MTRNTSRQCEHAAAPITPVSQSADPRLQARDLADRLESLLERAPLCVETITQALEGFNALAASAADAAEVPLRKLEAACHRGETLQQELSATADRLTREGEKNQHRIELLFHTLGAGETLQDRLQECGEQLKLQADDYQKRADSLAQTTDRHLAAAEQRCAQLTESTQAAAAAEDALRRTTSVADEIRERIEQEHEAILANRQTLNELNRQNESLRDMVRQAEATTDALRRQLAGLLTEPQTVVSEAKQQAVQLTAVCRAVKKVFSALSQTSLLATEKIERLAKLHAEATQATAALQQWVNEAVRMQKLLEGTLRQAPVIAPTPSPARIVPAPRITPAEVANLIADAKRQHAREKQPTPSAP
jgi:chromosome segregation ATPase